MINVKAEGNRLVIKLYGCIGKYVMESDTEGDDCNVCSVAGLNTVLKNNKDAALIDVYINSNGGSVTEGIAIYNVLKRHKAYKRVYIDGIAASIASVIAMAGNAIYMPKSSMMMIHNAWTYGEGNSDDFRKIADDLDKFNEIIRNAYMHNFKQSEDELSALMDAETYLTAEECLRYGLCTSVIDDADNTATMAQNAVREHKKKIAKLEEDKRAIENELSKYFGGNNGKVERVNDADGAETGNEAEPIGAPEPETTETKNELRAFFNF